MGGAGVYPHGYTKKRCDKVANLKKKWKKESPGVHGFFVFKVILGAIIGVSAPSPEKHDFYFEKRTSKSGRKNNKNF